jgi:hypothetical protein
MRRSAEAGVAYAIRRPRFTPRSGANSLALATQGKVIRRRSGGVVRLKNAKPYAAAIDKGARPHIIRIRRRKALRFVGKGGGLVFRRSVQHPGNRPYRFLSRARDQASDSFLRGMSRRMAEIARRF